MKRILVFGVLFLTTLFASAQTQQGFVKTKGRMDAQGNLIPGQGLRGATVSVQGRTTVLVQKDDGAFSFPVATDKFRLDSVRKKGYHLVDLDACPRTYYYSSNPLYIVMETPEQQLQDQLAAEKKIRRNLLKQLQEREDEIEDLKANQKISNEEYRQALQKLYQDQENNEQLIKDMAKRYSELDYDQLDEFYRQVSYYIENGELVKADSLLKTRGDITAQVADIKQRGQTLQEERSQLEKAEAVQQADIEEAARRCYSYFETFKAQHLNDTAAYYIELRASLDSSNTRWQDDAGSFAYEYLADYKKALEYYQLSLQNDIKQFGEHSGQAASSYHNVGCVCYQQSDYDKALEYLNKALFIADDSQTENVFNIAKTYNEIGLVYSEMGNRNLALEYYNKSLAIRMGVLGENHPDLASSYVNIGASYSEQGNFRQALELFEKAMSIFTSNYGECHPDIASCHNAMGVVYSKLGQHEEALEHHEKALTIRKTYFGETHPDVARSYNNISQVYSNMGSHRKALEFLEKALVILKNIVGENHPEMATIHNNIGKEYEYLGDYSKAMECYKKGLAIRESLGENHPDLAGSCVIIGDLCVKKGNQSEALTYYNKALDICKSNEIENDVTARCYQSIGDLYGDLGEFPQALEYLNKALDLMLTILGTENKQVASIYNSLVFIHYYLGDGDKAIELMEKVLRITENEVGRNHADVAACYNNLGWLLYSIQHEYGKALVYLHEALSIMRAVDVDPRNIASTCKIIGDAYAAQEDYSTALEYYNQALTIREEFLGQEHTQTLQTREKISEIEAKMKEKGEE